MKFQPGDRVHGFTVTSEEKLAEIDGMAYVMRHENSKARLLYLANEDENKAFAIGFKTPPANSTGVFHILEHSVLCGSARFPVKEPFVNLIKSSMQTFLNAMTYPDKTLYPVASTNEQDLLNLMDVYMDAVLNPMIYEKRAIFEQEGWHYELDSTDGSLRYNGVVYNEMKGVLSEAENILYNTLCENLFPDTTYAFESGGDPATIPDLTYEDFLDTHKRHYRLDNSYLFLYGNLDVDRALAFLDERYLSVVQETVSPPNEIAFQEPVNRQDIVKRMVTAPEKACMGLAYVVGTAKDRMRAIAADILMDVLMGSNEAPLKRALLAAGIAGEAQGYLAESMLQPAVIIQLKGITGDAPDRFREIVEETISGLCKNGIDHKRIEASLSRAEFTLREYDFGVSDGVMLAMNSMAGWLYDDDMATAYLRYEDAFAKLRASINTGYFERLARELILENNHMVEARIEPIEQSGESSEAKRLAAVQADMDAEEKAQVEKDVAILRRLQEQEDSAEALATLPLLTLDDIAQAPEEISCKLLDDTPLPCLYHDIPTHGINYVYSYFEARTLREDDLPYASILSSLLGKLATESYSADELDTLSQTYLGSMRFFLETHENASSADDFAFKFVATTSSLSENIEYATHLQEEVLTTTRFDDKAKIKDILTQQRIALEQAFSTAGHAAAMLRCASYYQPTAVINDATGGVEFYRFLKSLLEHFDERFEELVAHLTSVSATLFSKENVLISFTGSEQDHTKFWKRAGNFGLGDHRGEKLLVVRKPVLLNEAFIVPTDVCYAATGFDRRIDGIAYTGVWNVAGRALSYDYLWNEVRVKGGAYGVGFKAGYAGPMQFYSYRDPHLDETLARFAASADWLANFTPSESEMRGYIISSVAGHDAPMKARNKARRQDADYLAGHPQGYRDAIRADLIAATPEKVTALAPTLSHAIDFGSRCVFGNEEIIKNSTSDFNVIDLLG